jgi:Spy/CpxP family protein refolding chaperone
METRRVRLLIVLAVASLVSAAVPLLAQESATPKAKAKGSADGRSIDVRRVPPHFSRLGLTIEQREAIYKIRAQHLEKIEALQRQIDQEEEKMMAESEAALTDEQRTALGRLRTTASEKKGAAPKAKGSERPAGKPGAGRSK